MSPGSTSSASPGETVLEPPLSPSALLCQSLSPLSPSGPGSWTFLTSAHLLELDRTLF